MPVSFPRRLLAALAGAALLLGANAPKAHAQFTENFNAVANNTNPATFSNETNSWFVGNPTGTAGVYQSNKNTAENFSTIAAPGFTNLSTAYLTFDLLNPRDAGAVLRADSGAFNAVTLIVRPTVGDMYFVQRTTGMFGAEVGRVNIAGINAANLRVNFSSVGDTFTASIADLAAPNTVLRTTSYTYAAGTVLASGRGGFYQYGGSGTTASQFDNVRLSLTPGGTGAPEPASVALLIPALGGLGVVVRRRKAAHA